jgi:hypothetical protein
VTSDYVELEDVRREIASLTVRLEWLAKHAAEAAEIEARIAELKKRERSLSRAK